MKDWEQLSIDEAKQHPLYGVKGWLLFILVIISLNSVFSIFNVLFNYQNIKIFYGDFSPVLAFISIFIAAINGLIVYMGFTKDHRFPEYVIMLLYFGIALSIIAVLLVALYDARLLPIAASGLGAGVVGNLLFIWFFKASKRVNVTYFHRAPKDA